MLAAGISPPSSGEQVQVEKPVFRNQYSDGPMAFVGQQLVKRMADKGWPCRVSEHFRTPERQEQLRKRGNSKAGPWQSPHQYGLAVDVIHQTKGWNVPERFWVDLAAVVRIVESTYGVELTHGHWWMFRDSAHVELKNWRDYQRKWGKRRPTQLELDVCFSEAIPSVWKAHVATVKGARRSSGSE